MFTQIHLGYVQTSYLRALCLSLFRDNLFLVSLLLYKVLLRVYRQQLAEKGTIKKPHTDSTKENIWGVM